MNGATSRFRETHILGGGHLKLVGVVSILASNTFQFFKSHRTLESKLMHLTCPTDKIVLGGSRPDRSLSLCEKKNAPFNKGTNPSICRVCKFMKPYMYSVFG